MESNSFHQSRLRNHADRLLLSYAKRLRRLDRLYFQTFKAECQQYRRSQQGDPQKEGLQMCVSPHWTIFLVRRVSHGLARYESDPEGLVQATLADMAQAALQMCDTSDTCDG